MKRTFCAAALAGLIITACAKDSGQTDDASPATSDSPVAQSSVSSTCSMVSDAEMSEALGAPVTGREETTSTRCIYRTAAPLVYADVEVDRENADAAWQGINAGDSLIGAPQDSLEGVGDKAFFGPRDRLYFRKGQAFVAIEAGFDEKVRERAVRIARLVSGKL